MATKREKLSCGCRIRVAIYPKKPWNNSGRIDVNPDCKKNNHKADLEALAKALTMKG